MSAKARWLITRYLSLITHDLSLTSGEENGRSDSVVGHRNADSEAHWRFSRRPLRLSQRQTFTTLLSDAVGVSILRHRARAGGCTEQEVSGGPRHLEPFAEGLSYQSQFGWHSRCFWCTRRTECRTDLLGRTGRRQAQVSAVHK